MTIKKLEDELNELESLIDHVSDESILPDDWVNQLNNNLLDMMENPNLDLFSIYPPGN